MFATVDDLEGAVELMVFEKTLAAAEAALQVDEIVLVKGRVDHKEGGKVCVHRAGASSASTPPTPRSSAPASTPSRPPSRPSRCASCSTASACPRR